jgi:hypothetical protein
MLQVPLFHGVYRRQELIQLIVVNKSEIPAQYDIGKLVLIQASLYVTTVHRIIQTVIEKLWADVTTLMN